MEALNITPQGVYADCTAGGGGHSVEIAKRLSSKGRLVCIDRDAEAITACKERLRDYADRVLFVHSTFSSIKQILKENGIDGIDGALLDLGVSSHQIDTPERGFSFKTDAALDMRMDCETDLTAAVIVNTYSEAEIADILWKYGEERYSRQIAQKIVYKRKESPIKTTEQLVEMIKAAMPAAARREEQHPAKRSFQALRIAVNDELGEVANAVLEIPQLLNKEGRIAVITFHSLEDRIVKQEFVKQSRDCICPPDFPVCVCDHRATIKIITKKPILPSAEQIKENRRAASAKLRVAERL